MLKWTIKIDLSVSENWVEDGFDASERVEQIEELLMNDLLPFAHEGEFKVKAKITKAPTQEKIRKLQGY
jgi:hypothetical protein